MLGAILIIAVGLMAQLLWLSLWLIRFRRDIVRNLNYQRHAIEGIENGVFKLGKGAT